MEKVILFANSRLGELSDTIGSLRYSSYDESRHKEYPNLADGGLHHMSSSGSDGDSGMVSCASLSSDEGRPRNGWEGELDGDRDERAFEKDSSKEETRKQIRLRDRLRISRPMFQKADFLGEDFLLLSAVDEAGEMLPGSECLFSEYSTLVVSSLTHVIAFIDAYAAVGVELMHLLKYVVRSCGVRIFFCTTGCHLTPDHIFFSSLPVREHHCC